MIHSLQFQWLGKCEFKIPVLFAKIKLAARLREQTTVTVAWIAERLNMGSRGHLMHLLYLKGKNTDPGNGHQRTLEI